MMIAMTIAEQELITWLEEHGRAPKETSRHGQAYNPREREVAHTLRQLRYTETKGGVGQDIAQALDKMLPEWRKELQARRDPESVLTAAHGLVNWCREHHSGVPVKEIFDQKLCDDQKGHSKWWATLRRFKRAVGGKTQQDFPDVYEILDEAFGPTTWRPKPKGGGKKVNDKASGKASGGGGGKGSKRPRHPCHDSTSDRDHDLNQHSTTQRMQAMCLSDEEGEEEEEEASQAVPMHVHQPPTRPLPTGAAQSVGGGIEPACWDIGTDVREGQGEAPSAACSTIDPLRQQSALQLLALQKKPIALYGVANEEGQSVCGIEKQGYVEGAIFVLSPSIRDWMGALSQPLPQQSVRESGRAARKRPKGPLPIDPFAGFALTAQYKGYGRWRHELQQGTFMVLCLRCPPQGLTTAQQQQAVKKIEDKKQAAKMHALFRGRQRRPFPSVFPIVGGSDVQDLDKLLSEACVRLQEIMGAHTEAPQVSLAVAADEGVVVKVITRGTATLTKPFAVVNAGPLAQGPSKLAVRERGAVGEKGIVLLPMFRLGPVRPKGRDADKLLIQGNVGEGATNAALVALSFLRAHGEWVGARYRLRVDPSGRFGRDYVYSTSPLGYTSDGQSGGIADAVQMLLYCTGLLLPSELYVLGRGSISGAIMSVTCYREKLLTLGREVCPEGSKAHVLVPSCSLREGVLVEEEIKHDAALTCTTISQVRLPGRLAREVRVLGVENMFDCFDLCVPPTQDAVAVPRPVLNLVKGLAVAKAISHTGWPGLKPSWSLVEAFLFPGDGQLIVTTGTPGNKNIARLGVGLVSDQWDMYLKNYPGIEVRASPQDATHDLHLNVLEGPNAPVASGSVAWAAAAAYMALLVGRHVPPTAAFLAEAGATGFLTSPPLDQSFLRLAQEQGITTIFSSIEQEAADKAFLAGCSEEMGGNVQIHHMTRAREVLPHLANNMNPEAKLPDLPQRQGEETAGAVGGGAGADAQAQGLGQGQA